MDINQTQLVALLQEVATYADTNGIYCIYHFGGNADRMPRAFLGIYGSSSAFYNAWWSDSVVPSGRYAGLTLWEASFQGLWTPLIQTVDSHPSTIGYGLWNEPVGLPNSPGPLVTLHNYYEYITQRIRTLSVKATVFQVTSNGGGDDTSIKAVAPTPDLKPYVFEAHMYSTDPTAFAGWAQGVTDSGAYGFLGEWHQDITNTLNLVKQYGFATTWFSWTCGGGTDLLTPTSCQPDANAIALSQGYQQILGPP